MPALLALLVFLSPVLASYALPPTTSTDINKDGRVNLIDAFITLPTSSPAPPPPTSTLPPSTINTYYISNNGNDANSGQSPTSAWRTPAKVSSVSFQPGATILFEGGQTFTGIVSLDSSDSSTPPAPITLGSYGSGRSTISVSSTDGIAIYNLGNVKINNINVLGTGMGLQKSGINIYTDANRGTNISNITVSDVQVSSFGKHGISIGSWGTPYGFSDLLINNANVYSNQDGIVSYAQNKNTHKNIHVTNSITHDNPGISGLSSPTGSGIVLGGVDGGVIEHNKSYNNGASNTSGSGPIGIWAYDSNNVTIQFNESYDNKSSGGDGGGFDFDGGVSNSYMQYNYSHGNVGAGILVGTYPNSGPNTGNTIRYNISENDGKKGAYAGLTIYGVVQSLSVYNNTFYKDGSAPNSSFQVLSYLASFSNNRIINNIFYTDNGAAVLSSQVGISPNQILFKGNNYFSGSRAFNINWNGTNYNSLSSWRSTGQETSTGLQVNPLFASGYKLQSSSPMINTGLDLSSLGINSGGRDYFGTSVPRGLYDVGASEY